MKVPTAQDMQAFGEVLGAALREEPGPLVVALEGELGAGKTTLVAAVLRSCGVTGTVRSPTYTLIEPYEMPGLSLYHLDLYRLGDPQEMEPLGLADLLTPDAILLIEWPSRGAGALPPVDLWLQLDYLPQSGRQVSCRSGSPAGDNLMQRLLTAIPELGPLSSSFN